MDHDGSSPVELFLNCFATSMFFPIAFPVSQPLFPQEDNRKEHEATSHQSYYVGWAICIHLQSVESTEWTEWGMLQHVPRCKITQNP